MLYTILMEYRGGTYVSQVHACNADDALRSWAAALDAKAVAELGAQRKRELMDKVDLDLTDGMGPVRLQGLVNAWCTTAAISGGSMLINIVATVSETHL